MSSRDARFSPMKEPKIEKRFQKINIIFLGEPDVVVTRDLNTCDHKGH